MLFKIIIVCLIVMFLVIIWNKFVNFLLPPNTPHENNF